MADWQSGEAVKCEPPCQGCRGCRGGRGGFSTGHLATPPLDTGPLDHFSAWPLASLLLALALVLGIAPVARAQLVVGVDNGTVPLRVYDAASGLYVESINQGNLLVRGLAADEAARTLYLTTGPQLWAIPYDPPRTPRLVGAFSGNSTSVAGDLAFDPARRKLYGTGGPGASRLLEVNPATAATALVRDFAGADLGGLVYDPARDRLLFANDGPPNPDAPAFPTRGIYALPFPYTDPPQKLIDYPQRSEAFAETDVDALALDGDLLFLVTDEPEWMYTANLLSLTYGPPILQTYLTRTYGSSGAAWAPGLLPAARADLFITLTDAPDPQVVVPGGQIVYSLRVEQRGPANLGASAVVTFTLPAGAAFVSSSPPRTPIGGRLQFSTGPLLSGAAWMGTVTVSTLAQGVLAAAADVSPPAGVTDPDLTNNAAQAQTLVRPMADLSITLSGPPPCTALPGQTMEFVGLIRNLGVLPATTAEWRGTWPPGLRFVDSEPPMIVTGATGRVVLPALVGGAERAIRLRLNAAAPGTFGVESAVSSALPELTPDDNQVSMAAIVASDITPTGPVIRVELSTVHESITSLIPGLDPPARAVAPLGRPWASPSGSRWAMRATTDAAPEQSVLILAGGTGGVGEVRVVVQQGVTELPIEPGLSFWFGPRTAAILDPMVGIDDAGQVAFSGSDGRFENIDDQFVMRYDGLAFHAVWQEGLTPVPGFGPGSAFGNPPLASAEPDPVRVAIVADGSVVFSASFHGPGVGATNNAALFAADGQTILVREGFTTPRGARTSENTAALAQLTAIDDFRIDASGQTALVAGRLNLSTTVPAPGGVNQILFATGYLAGPDGTVVVQENLTLPFAPAQSSAADTQPWDLFAMDPAGRWLAAGRWRDGTAWAARQGVLLATSGLPIMLGQGGTTIERWTLDPARPTQRTPFEALAGNSVGDVLIVGTTDHSDPQRRLAVVLNGRTILARANDPVDLDGNGLLDDDAFLAGVVPDSAALGDEELRFVATLRTRAAALGCATLPPPPANLILGQALVRIPIPRACPPDFDRDGVLSQEDLSGFIAAFFAESPNFVTGPGGFAVACPGLAPPFDLGLQADFNGDCSVPPDQEDLGGFLTAFAGGCP